jgi:hypothetical protein
VWNSTTPFTYAVNFTNTTAEALFSLAGPLGTVTFSFSGSRVDDNRPGWKPSDNGNYTPIALNTADPAKPRFQFTNGSQFVWKNYFNGRSAIASAAALSIDESIALWWKWLWLLLMVVAGGLSLEGM